MKIDKDLEKKLMHSLDELEDKIIMIVNSPKKHDALEALKKARELLDLDDLEE